MGLVLEGYSIDVTPFRPDVVPEVLEVHVVPSDEVRMVPELPTATCDGLEVVLVLDVLLFFAHEMIVKKKIKINIMYIFFIFISFSNLHSQHPIKL